MNLLKDKNILFFCPSFFNYEHEIKLKMQNLGANVILYDERPSNTFISKALLRLNKSFLHKSIQKYYKSIINQIDIKIDYIFIVNPEAISPDIVNELKLKFEDAILCLYMWDSVKNKPNSVKLFKLFDHSFTFDRKDSICYNITFLPLFYIDKYKTESKKPIFDFLFFGTAHSDRYQIVKNIKSYLDDKYIFKEYYYLSNPLLYIYNYFFENGYKTVKFSDISFKSLTQDDIIQLVIQSNCIIDICHPNQSGLTMRSIEALGAKKKLITTNHDVKNYDFYHSSNICVIDRGNYFIDKQFLDSNFQQIENEIYEKYSIGEWLKTILML